MIAPTLQSETGGAAASLKFAPSDASGTAHTWILNAPPVGGGFTLTLPQASGTLALNNSFGPSGTNHSSGLVPDPGPNPGVARFLREDGKWVALGQRAATSGVASMRPAVLRLTPDQGDTEMPPRFPVVVAHASLDHQNTPLGDIIQYAPETDGTFRLTISVFVESRCASGTLLVNASLSPIAGHTVGQEKSLDCTEAYSNGTATITAHGATGVPITPAVKFKGVEAESLRYMVDVIVEQLQ